MTDTFIKNYTYLPMMIIYDTNRNVLSHFYATFASDRYKTKL